MSPFDGILREFEEAYAKYGDIVFFLAAYTHDELGAERENLGGKNPATLPPGTLCFLPTGPSSEGEPYSAGYWVLGPTQRHRFGKWEEEWTEPLDCFRTLAAKAGAALPPDARKTVRFEPHGPVAWWLAYMWWQSPPSAEDLRPLDTERRRCRAIWCSPFLDSKGAIERGGLCSAETPEQNAVADEGEWLIPMSLADMANRLGNVGTKKAKTILNQYGLKQAGNRQLWTVRLDGMPGNLRAKLEQGL